MQMPTEDNWHGLSAHTGTHHSSPPTSVVLAVAALLNGDEIKGSWVTYQPSQPTGHTTWTELIATDDRLLCVETLFNAENFDSHEASSKPGVTPTLKAAWSRRLSDARELSFGVCATSIPEFHRGRLPVGGVHLVFNDGTDVDLRFNQQALGGLGDAYERSETFLTAIRVGTGL